VRRTLLSRTGARRGLAIGAAAGLAAIALAATSAAALVAPLAGIYHGTVTGTKTHHGHNPGRGWFEEKPTVFGKRVKPACDHVTICKKAIIAPSIRPKKGVGRGCNAKPATLESGGFPIQRAQFHHTERAPIGRDGRRLKIHFEGKWVRRAKVKGFTRIKGGGCDSGKMRWTMTTSATP
jgi:hypothetical protein